MKKTLCIFLSIIISLSVSVTAFAATKTDCGGTDECPSIIIPGLLQSETHLYNDDGTLAYDKDGNAYTAPFYLDTTGEIVWTALKNVFFPLLSVVFFQTDYNEKLASSLADTLGKILMEKIKSDSEGNTVYNIDAIHYNCSYAECSEADKQHILNCIPISDYIDKVGGDHMYFLSYNSLGNLHTITDELYELIQKVKEETGHDKINIVPISQGGTICNDLLERYPQVTESLNRIIYVVPALDGSSLISDIYSEGINDADDALYGYMLPSLMKDELTGYIINLALRILPSDVLNNVLDKAVDGLIENYLKNSTCLWAFVSQDKYQQCADKYLSSPEDAYIRAQTDSYYKAQVNSKANILKAINSGVEVFDIVNYNHPLYSIAGSWDKVNADGIIQLNSTSMGAYSRGVDNELPDGYTQQGNCFGTCTDSSHNHIDPHNIVDASTGLLPDNTFYFYDGDHEKTASDDALISLVIRLLTDESFTNVYSYPDDFPQFNTARVTKDLRIDLKTAKEYDTSTLTSEDAAELSEAINQVDEMLLHTNVDLEETKNANDRFYAIWNKINGITPEKESIFTKGLTKFFGKINSFVEDTVGYQGYSDAKK